MGDPLPPLEGSAFGGEVAVAYSPDPGASLHPTPFPPAHGATPTVDGSFSGAAELPPPQDLRSQQASTPAPRFPAKPLVIIPLCRKGDRAGIEKHLLAGAAVDETDIEGNTPLHVAVEAPKNEIATVQCLLEHGAAINAINYIGAAPLHYVCLRKSNHRGIANILLENAANIDCQTLAGKTALHFACEQQLPELVEVLCLFGANGNAIDVEGNTPIHLDLAKPGGRDTVKRQIAEHLLACNSVFQTPNLEGFMPVHLACRAGYVRCLQLLLERQADVSAMTCRGETGLHLACHGNHGEVTQLLLQAAPQTMDLPDVDGNTPLHMCAFAGSLDSALLLLRMGADTNLRNKDRRTAFDISKIRGTDLNSSHNPELAQVLKDAQKGGNCRQS